jgi:hypothetical protein
MASRNFDRDCAVCLGQHDDAIHLATVRLHSWWRESLLLRIDAPDCGQAPIPGARELTAAAPIRGSAT